MDNPVADVSSLELKKLVSRQIEALALLLDLLNDEIVAQLIPVVWSGPAVEVKFGPPSE